MNCRRYKAFYSFYRKILKYNCSKNRSNETLCHIDMVQLSSDLPNMFANLEDSYVRLCNRFGGF